jgi:outer membrane receptor for ferrienterochelin and colicins
VKIFIPVFWVFTLFSVTSNAQGVRITDPSGKPVAQALVVVKPLSGEGPSTFVTGSDGIAHTGPFLGKIQLLISHVSFETHVDTLQDIDGEISVSLVPKQVKLEEVVVTSEYTPRTAGETVHPVTVIGRNEIDNRAAPSLEEALSQELNVRISQDPVLGAGLTMNGLSGQNIKILVDGVPVIGRLDGNIDPGQLNLNQVSRIEIVNGPMAAAYGTDAAGGVVNLISRPAVENTWQSGASLYYETIGQYNADLFAGFNRGRSSVVISGGRNFFDGWSSPDTGRWQEWKPKEQYFGNAKYRWTGKNFVLGYHLNGFYEKISNKGVPRITPYYAYAFDEYYKTDRFTNQLTAAWTLKNDFSVNANVAYSWYRRTKNTFRKDLVSLDENLVASDSLGNSASWSPQDTTVMNAFTGRAVLARVRPSSKFNFQGGTDILVEQASGTRFDEGVEQTGDYALFASAEYIPVRQISIKPAVRVTYNTAFEAPVIPSLSVRYEPIRSLVIRASYGRGFRAPGVKERYLYFVDINHNIRGNENLQPERSDNFYLSADYTFHTGKVSNTTTLSVFYSDIDNLITLAQPDPGASLFTYVNIGTYSTHGGTLSHTVGAGGFSCTAGIAYTGRYNIYADSGDFDTYLYSPDYIFRAQYGINRWNLTVSAYLKITGKLPGYQLNADESVTDGYRFLDATLRKGFFNNTLYVTAGMKNILGITSVNSVSQTSAHGGSGDEMPVGNGRSAFVRLQCTIGK